MALIKTEKGFAIEFDCRLRDNVNEPARIMDSACEYQMFLNDLLEAIQLLAHGENDASHIIYGLAKIVDGALPTEEQFEVMFKNIA